MTLNSGTPCLHSWSLGYKCVLQSPSITNVKCAFHKGDLEIIKENLEKVKSHICCGTPRKRNVTLFSVIFLTMGYVSHQDFTKDTCWLWQVQTSEGKEVHPGVILLPFEFFISKGQFQFKIQNINCGIECVISTLGKVKQEDCLKLHME